ncbi:hypothetical protein G9P44_004999 [Scheffersomyces stipitis]|nr:hypothetical protein G9P44_004999 [Scheffersomyces stipitis]
MKDSSRKSYPSGGTANVDTSFLEKISTILEKNDIPQLLSLIETSSLTKLLSNWSYFASINNHNQFIDLSVKLSKITSLFLQQSFSLVRPQIIEFYKDILNNHLKVIYRALNNSKPSLTNPNLRILTNIVQYDGSCAHEFLNTFDLTLNVLPNLLVPTKTELENKSTKEHLSIRYNFIRFWLTLASSVPHYHRNDLFANHHKIVNNLWKFLYIDSVATTKYVVEFLDSKILQEVNFKRASKCKILNENFMYKIQSVFAKLEQEKWYLDFVYRLATDSKLGLVYPHDSLFTSSTTGVPVHINNKTFKINNKLLYTLLTTLKPSESHAELAFVTKILEVNPELVAPYMNWMVQHGGGYLDPSLTSWWMAHTLLYSNILQLSINPTLFDDQHSSKVNVRLIQENVSLAPISKSSLVKCLESSNNPLIIQFALQLIMFTVQKLESFIEIMESNNQELLDLVFFNLPDLPTIIQVYNKFETGDSKLIKLTSSIIIQKYESLYPRQVNSGSSKLASAGISSIINQDISKCSGYDITLLHTYLSIQANQQQEQELKWWNKTNGSNSLFTSLVRLSSDGSIGDSKAKIYDLLEKLTQDKSLFNKELIVSPLYALINSFSSDMQVDDKVWNLLDEVVSRTVRTPYKYLDLSHSKYGDCSLFIVAVFEQFKFILMQADISLSTNWLFNFLQLMIVIGQSKKSILQLLQDFLLEDEAFAMFVEENDLMSLLEFRNFKQTSEDSFFNFTVGTTSKDLMSKLNSFEKRLPTSDLDFAALLTRVRLTIEETSGNYENLLIEIISKVGNYLLSTKSKHLLDYISSGHFWNPLLMNSVAENLSDTKFLFGGLFSEVLEQISDTVSLQLHELQKYLFDLFCNQESISVRNQNYISRFAWILSDTQLLQIVEGETSEIPVSNEHLVFVLAQECLNRKLRIAVGLFKRLCQCSLSSKTVLIPQIVESGLVHFDDKELVNMLDDIIASKSDHYLLKSFSTSTGWQSQLVIQYLIEHSDVKNDYLQCFIAYSLTMSDWHPDDDQYQEFFKKVTPRALSVLQNGNFEQYIQWRELLCIFARGVDYIDPDAKNVLVDTIFKYVEANGYKNSFIAEFASLVFALAKSTVDINKQIGDWVHKSMLYITKKFAESSQLSFNFNNFLKEMQKVIIRLPDLSLSVWKLAPIAIMNTQLEVLFRHSQWIKEDSYVEYANIVIMTASKNIIDYEKLLQIFINNESSCLTGLPTAENARVRYLSALVLHNLFFFDSATNSTLVLLEKVMLLYLGSIQAADLLLKDILVKIESHISKSWMVKVANWDFVEEMTSNDIELVGEERLILKDKSDFVVSLNKNYVKNTILYRRDFATIPYTGNISAAAKWDKYVEFYNRVDVNVEGSYQSTVYDPEFLMMLIINNDELVSFQKTEETADVALVGAKLNIKRLIDSSLLQFIVVQLGNPQVRNISQILLAGVLKSLEQTENFKDKNIFKVYVANILNTVRKQESRLPSLNWYIYSSFVPILVNPGHILYEKVFRYVLSNPSLKRSDIPLYISIVTSKADDSDAENDESYYKQITWLLEKLIEGTGTKEDLDLIKFRSVVEWIMNLTNSPYITMKIKSMILKFLFVVQGIDQGSDMLITRFGILTNLEQLMANNVSAANELLEYQLKLNIDQLVVRFGISVGSSKRIKEWTGEDLPAYVKRVCSEPVISK